MMSLQDKPQRMRRSAANWLASWWRIVHFGAVILVMALSVKSYTGDNRTAMARHLYANTAPLLLWFSVLIALISLVVIRIVVVTAISYGLSQYALQVVVRVLVLELIPLTAALFVALRCSLPGGAQLSEMRLSGQLAALRAQGIDPMLREVLPRVLACLFSVITLAAVSGLVSLVLAYLTVYGFSPWGFGAYTRTVGQIFSPAVSLIFMLKTLFFGLAVALIPMVSSLHDATPTPNQSRTTLEMHGLLRMFVMILLIEVASLVGNYY